MPTAEEFIAGAWDAAPTFGLKPDSITVLSHSENVVCDLATPKGDHLIMRLHRPGYNTVDELESEVQWVAALGEAGIPVPRAVPTKNGGHYTTVQTGEETRHVGVIEWVDGTPLGSPIESEGSGVVRHYGRTGALAAKIRQHSLTWSPPSDFTRRRWDAASLVGETPLWGRFWEVEALTAEQRSLFSQARKMLQAELEALPTEPERFGLIHADLHLGNLMTDGGQLTVIDFDDAGFGWFAHELAVALHPVLDEPWEADARAALLEGYRGVYPLDEIEERLIDTFLTMRCLMIIGWLDARSELPIFQHFGALAEQATAAAERYLAKGGTTSGRT